MGTDVKFIVKGTGLQFDTQEVAPRHFNFKDDVLRKGIWDRQPAALILNLFIREMYPLKEGENLFFWDDLKPHVAFSVVNSAISVNERINSGGIKEVFKPIPDALVLERLKRDGIMSPKDVEIRFAPVGPKNMR